MDADSDISVTRSHLTLPWAASVALVSAVISGAGVYYTTKSEVAAAKETGTDAHQFAERVEAAAVQRFIVAERRIEKLEETGNRTLLLLERIDERTGEMKRRIDALPAK